MDHADMDELQTPHGKVPGPQMDLKSGGNCAALGATVPPDFIQQIPNDGC